MWFLPSKKKIEKSFNKIKESIAELTSQSLNNRILINKLENKIDERFDSIIIKLLDKVQVSNNPIKTKTGLRQVQENKVIQAFRRTKKQIAKEKIKELRDSVPIPSIKTKLMQELGISKASFYNYLKELENEALLQKSLKVHKS